MTAKPFEDLPVIGSLTPQQAAAKLREMDEVDAADKLERPVSAGLSSTYSLGRHWRSLGDRAWQHTAHAFGFLPMVRGDRSHPILGISSVEADTSLRHGRIKITLNRLRVADYPGRGTHRVLIDFYGRNQIPGTAEDLHFNATYRVRDGERAPIIGYPIFVGLNTGGEGVAFQCHTINVKNEADEVFLDFLESDVFKTGLKLATSVQPAIAPLSSMALALTRSVARRYRNVSVQDFYLGLDFAGTTMGARLAQGDYIVAQIPERFQRIWRWEDWVYDGESGMIVAKNQPDQIIPYNYLVFGVSRYEGE